MLRDPFGIAFLGYYLLMALVGMSIPDDILSHAWAREFSDLMASVVPQIDRVTALNIKPDVNKFYFSVLWVGSPVLIFIVVLGAGMRGPNTNYVKNYNSPIKQLLNVFIAILGSSLLLGLFGVENSSRLTNVLFGNFLIRGLFGQILFVNGPLLFLVGTCVMLPYFLLTGKYQKAIASKKHDKAEAQQIATLKEK